MPTATLRPNGTLSSSGILVGAASAHVALNDNSDSSYVNLYYGGSAVSVDFGTFTLPAGAATRQARVRVRAKANPTTGVFAVSVPSSGAWFANTVGSTFTDLVDGYASISWSQATLDAVFATVTASPSDDVWISELYLDVDYALQPSTSVSAPTGTLTTTTSPTVVWTHTPGTDGGAQSHYQVRVFTAAQYGIAGFNPASSPSAYDTGVRLGASASALVGPLPNSTTYRAYVRTAQSTAGAPQWADYAFTSFSLAATAAEILTLSAVPDSVNARTRITVTRDTGTTNWGTIELERSTDGGVTWQFVRGVAGQVPPGDVWIGYDYEAGNGQTVIYRARATYLLSGLPIAGAWVQSGSVSWSAPGVDWLKSPSQPAMSMAVTVISLPVTSRERPRGVFSVIGRADPVVVSDVLHLSAGELTLLTLDDAESAELASLLEVDVLLFQTRPGERFGTRYLSIGAVSEERVGNVGDPTRHWVLPFVEVVAPADYAVDVPGLTWADIVATYVTWTTFIASIPTWGTWV